MESGAYERTEGVNSEINNLALEILKWVGLVFVAGFIGYFGRYLSMILLEKVHKKKTKSPPEVKTGEEASSGIQDKGVNELKLEKKRIKQRKSKRRQARNEHRLAKADTNGNAGYAEL